MLFTILFIQFFVQYTHTFYTFYIYSTHILFIFLVIFYHFYAKITHFSCIITHFRAFLMHFRAFFHQFPTIFCTFAQTLRVFLCTSAQLYTLPASSFSVLLYKLFLHIALANCHSLYKLFSTFAQTFSSLPPYYFQLVRNFMTICFQLFHSFPQLFLM